MQSGNAVERVVVPHHCDLSALPKIWATLRFRFPRAERIEVAQEHVSEVARTFDAHAVDAAADPRIPKWKEVLTLVDSSTMAAQFDGVAHCPLAALPLLDAFYRGCLT